MLHQRTNVDSYSPERFNVSYRSVSLEKVKKVLDAYLEGYTDVVFVVRRNPKDYQLDLEGERLTEVGI